MRVCLVSSSFYPATFYGGPISATWDLSKKLAEKGYEIYVSTTNANGKERLKNIDTKNYAKLDENIYVRYYHEQLINIFSFSFLVNIFSDIKKSDVVYVQYLFHYTVVFSLFFAWVLKKKVIICPRGSFSSFTLENNKIYFKTLWLQILIKPFSRKVIWQASSYLEKEDILKYLINARVEIISDGVNFNEFQDQEKISLVPLVKKYTDTKFSEISEVIFSMGRLHKIKGFNILINSFDLYLKDNKHAKLIIAGGDDGERENLILQITKMELEESVFLIGLIDFNQKKELLSSCSFFALASEFESFGIVITESLSCGTPVVVSDKTAWRDIYKNKCGIFAENQKQEFCDAFHEIKKENFTSEDCKNYVKENFDFEVVSQKFINLITKK